MNTVDRHKALIETLNDLEIAIEDVIELEHRDGTKEAISASDWLEQAHGNLALVRDNLKSALFSARQKRPDNRSLV